MEGHRHVVVDGDGLKDMPQENRIARKGKSSVGPVAEPFTDLS